MEPFTDAANRNLQFHRSSHTYLSFRLIPLLIFGIQSELVRPTCYCHLSFVCLIYTVIRLLIKIRIRWKPNTLYQIYLITLLGVNCTDGTAVTCCRSRVRLSGGIVDVPVFTMQESALNLRCFNIV